MTYPHGCHRREQTLTMSTPSLTAKLALYQLQWNQTDSAVAKTGDPFHTTSQLTMTMIAHETKPSGCYYN